MRKIYQIDCSARKEGSTSRSLAKKLLNNIWTYTKQKRVIILKKLKILKLEYQKKNI